MPSVLHARLHWPIVLPFGRRRTQHCKYECPKSDSGSSFQQDSHRVHAFCFKPSNSTSCRRLTESPRPQYTDRTCQHQAHHRRQELEAPRRHHHRRNSGILGGVSRSTSSGFVAKASHFDPSPRTAEFTFFYVKPSRFFFIVSSANASGVNEQTVERQTTCHSAQGLFLS